MKKNLSTEVPTVALVFASRVRHIAFDGKLLCETKHKSSAGGYCRGHYCSYSLDPSDFKRIRTVGDKDYKGGGGFHTTGVIPLKPLNEIEPRVIEWSICRKCLRRYNRELKRRGLLKAHE